MGNVSLAHFQSFRQNFIICSIGADPVFAKRLVADGLCPSVPRDALRANGTSHTLESHMPSYLASLRHKAFVRQDYRCFYCTTPMCEHDSVHFRATYRLFQAQAEFFFCTAEHLKPRSEGGRDNASNVVAACYFCNQTRHRAKVPLDAAKYRQRVQSRVDRARWLTRKILSASSDMH